MIVTTFAVAYKLSTKRDQREIELLVEAGFTPVDAIKIATLNGATYMGRQNEIGLSPPVRMPT